MKKLITSILCVTVFLVGLSAQAQNTDTVKTSRWSKRRNFSEALQLQVMYRQNNLGQLNSILNKSGIPSLSGNNVWFYLSTQHLHKKWLFEDGIGLTPYSTSEANGVKAQYNQYGGYLRLGYNISKQADFRLYPFVGLDFSGAILKIQDDARQNSTSDFSQELLNSTSSKTLIQPNFGVDLGVGFDYLIKMKPKKMNGFVMERNVPIGFRIGYYAQTVTGDWKLDNHTLNNGPANGQNALFFTFNIGLGYSIKR